jgi:hypothetical protein
MDSDGLTLERVIGTTTRHGTSLSASRADGSLAFAAGRLVVLSPAGPRAPAALSPGRRGGARASLPVSPPRGGRQSAGRRP